MFKRWLPQAELDRLDTLLSLFLVAPALLLAQALTPHPQEYVLNFQHGVASTDQIGLGATFTMETWVFLTAASPFAIIMGKANNPRSANPFLHYALALDSTGRKPTFIQSTGQTTTFRSINGPFDLPLSSWTHLAAVLDSGTMRLYVNGQQAASGLSPGIPAGATVPFGLGGAIPDGTLASLCCSLSGALREARVWSRALSVSELQAYPLQTLAGTEAGLLADWPLSDGSGSVVNGIGPQTATLTIQGSTTWAHTQLLDNGPYWEVQDLPSLTDINYGVQAALFLNVDHRPDILLAYTPYALDKPTAGPVLFLHNEGNRVFSPIKPLQPSMMVWPRNSTVADLDGDGYEDLVVADHGYDAPPYPGGITRIFMQRSGQMQDETDSRLPPGPAFTHDVCSADVNGDGSPDLFFASLHSGGAIQGPILYINDGKGHFKANNALLPPVFSGTSPPTFLSCRFVDVNRDGAPDLLLGAWGANPQARDWLLLNDGKGNLRDVTALSMPPKRGGATWATLGFATGDVNRDGWPDLIVSIQADANNGTTTTMQLLINNRDGTFYDQDDVALNVIRMDGFFDKTYALDLNHDGWPDLIAEENHFGVRLYQNMGGRFEDRTETLPTANSGARPRPADFDGDGRIDIGLFSQNKNQIAWGKNLWPAVCSYSVNASGWTFSEQGGDGSVDIVSSEPDCPWRVSGLPGWALMTSPSSGVGNGTVTFHVNANSGSALSGTVSVAGLPFAIEEQAATIPGLNFIGSMAHIAAEENWSTAFTLVNKGGAMAQTRLRLFGDVLNPSGSGPLTLPFEFPQQPPALGPLLAASFDRTLAANASLIVNTAGSRTPPVLVGSARLDAAGSVDGFAIFHQNVTAQEAVVPLETRNASSYLLVFDNTNGLVMGVAAENISAQNTVIGVVIRDDTGAQISALGANISLGGNGHTAFVLSDPTLGFSVTANKRGTIEFATPAGGRISVLGLRFTPPNNALTTIPALANVGAGGGSIAHIASGGDGWQTTFVLVNTGKSAASATLSFFADQTGVPLSLPLSFPQSGNDTTAVVPSYTKTVAAGATLVIVSAGAPQLLTGSAQLSTSGQVSGFVIFRHNGQEAVVPLEGRNANAYLLAFDNTAGTATGVAVNGVSTQPVNVPVLVRNDAGTQIASGSIALAANGHSAFTIGVDKFPEAAGIRGTIEFTTPANAQIGALGIRIPTGAAHTFTTLPALAK